jgi:hypothetical protein
MDAAARVSTRFADRTNFAALDGNLGSGFFIAHPVTPPTKGELRFWNAATHSRIQPDAITLPIAQTDRQRMALQAFDTTLEGSGNLARTILVLVLHEGAIDPDYARRKWIKAYGIECSMPAILISSS